MSATETASMHEKAVRRYTQLFIAGAWREPRSGRTFESLDPATDRQWAEIAEADEEDVDAAVKAARSRFESSSWRRMTGADRARLLRRLGELVERDADRLAELESLDNGKAIRETRQREISAIPQWLDYFAGMADKIQGETIPVNADTQAYTIREPVGVVGGILPWNSPALMFTWKLAPAITGGNTIVIKPAEFTSVTAFELARLCEEAGFPAGSVNVVSGFGAPTGRALVRHPDVDKIAFTGENTTAAEITKDSVTNLKRLSFELGGKAPHIVFADADYDQALTVAVEAGFIAAGQSCTCGSRLLLQRPIYDRFLADLAARADAIEVGDPLDPASQLGAQTSSEQLAKTERYVQSARDDGAQIVAGGRRASVPGLPDGYFYRPTVVAEVRPDMAVCRDEIFGPVLTAMPFDSEEEVLALANDTRYGLTAGLWTNDIRRVHRMTTALRAGTVWVNTFRVIHWAVPYGGVKMSGYGRENGLEVMKSYTDVKSVLIDHRTERPSWF